MTLNRSGGAPRNPSVDASDELPIKAAAKIFTTTSVAISHCHYVPVCHVCRFNHCTNTIILHKLSAACKAPSVLATNR